MQASPIEAGNQSWEEAFAQRMKRLQDSFRASSLVLVTSAVALMLFLRLPAPLVNEAARAELANFANGLTMFWGLVMTMTLFALFVPPFLALRKQARLRHRASDSEQSFDQWSANMRVSRRSYRFRTQ